MRAAQNLIDSLSPHLFWDVDTKQVDPHKHRDFIIVRCAERGRREDVRTIWDFYGPNQVREALLAAPSLSKKTIAFFANQFDLPHEAFRAHQRAQNWDE